MHSAAPLRQDERDRQANEKVVQDAQGAQMNDGRQQSYKKDHRFGISQAT
jgi:hypothetical protein